MKDEGDAVRFTLEAPRELAKFIAPKGSVALDGTSLTVNKVDGARFDVLLHPPFAVRSRPGANGKSAIASISKSIRWPAMPHGW